MSKVLLLSCALALPVASIHPGDEGGYDSPTKENFLQEYRWLLEILRREYPGHEFLILPVRHENTPPGWIWVPVGWRGHLIYRRPLKPVSACA